jgi:Family of unknown function (DUF5681)
MKHTYHATGGSRRNPNSLASLSQPGMTNNPGGRPKKTPLTDALRRLVETNESLKIKPDDDNATKAAKALIKKAISGDRSSFAETADRIEGKVAQKMEHDSGDQPVTIRVVYGDRKPSRD